MNTPALQKALYRDDADADATVPLTSAPENGAIHELAGSSSSDPPPPTYAEITHYIDPDFNRFEFSGLNFRDDHFASITSTQHALQKGPKTRISGEHVRLQNPRADSDPKYLQEWIEYMSRQAPSPYIVIHGSHWERKRDNNFGHPKSSRREQVTDFSIRINMRNYLWPSFRINDPTMMTLRTVDDTEKTWRGTVFKRRAPGAKANIEIGDDKPTLQEWCHRYCASPSKVRMFRLTRTVVGMDKEQLRNRLTGIVRSIGYKGQLDIHFPVADRAVDIYTKTPLNTWRLNIYVWWTFVLTSLWILSWPILYFATQRYDVVRAEWSFSRTDQRGNRNYTTVSEEQWIDKYSSAIKQLARDHYEGIAGEDLLNQILARSENFQPATARFGEPEPEPFTGIVGQVRKALRAVVGRDGWGYDS